MQSTKCHRGFSLTSNRAKAGQYLPISVYLAAMKTHILSKQGAAGTSFEIAGHDYTKDKLSIKMALSHMESLVGVYNGYSIGPPSTRFGWIFFILSIKPDFQLGIESEFSDMLAGYARERDRSRRLAMFLSDYLNSRNCGVKLKVVP